MYYILVKNKSNKPIPDASVTFRRSGSVLTTLTTGQDGTVQIDPDFDGALLSKGVIAVASAPGYKELGIDASLITPNWYFQLNDSPKTGLLIAGGVAGGLLLAGALAGRRKRRKGRKVGEAAPVHSGGLNPNVKLAAIGIGAIGVIYFVNKWLSTDPSRSHLPAAADTELNQLAAKGIYPTLDDTDVESLASRLVQAFDDCGTDMNAVDEVFGQMKNRADVLKLIKLYGVRDFKGCFDGDYFSMHSYNLSQAMAAELSASNYREVNKILSDNGVDYTF